MKTMERVFTLDRDLAQRASRKLRRYGRTLDDAVEYAMTIVVSMRGLPPFGDGSDRFFSEPNASRLRKSIADLNAKRNVVYHDLIEDSADA